jgi:hypothetical protein
LRRFVEEVGRRHPGKPPVLYGNCQAGWAVMLLAADCEGLVGPVVLNGSPLSYWAGASDANPMRLAGGLTGGAWLAHFLADLGNGRFDGAWLAQNFENLNPANTLWDKNYKVFANVDTERERFLEFERWWTGFYFLSREEITATVENLFIGNKLERGEMRVCEGSTAYRRVQEVRGKADAVATGVYGAACSGDPEFYAFSRNLEAYKEGQNKNSVVIPTTDSDYSRYLKRSGATAAARPMR